MFKWLGFEAGTEKGNNSASTIKHDVTTNDLTQDNHSTTGEEGSREPQGPPSSADVNDSDKQSEGQQSTAGSVSGALGMLSQFASAATKKAQKLKESVDETLEKTIIGDFQRENEKFVKEKQAKRTEDPVPPWVGYNEEEEMKSQILALSSDERHFLRDPPSGVEYHFDLDSTMPVALTILAEDDNLQKMRFNLVPKKVKEERFWRNYFYRVSLIKQSSQLSTLAQAETKRSGQDSKRSSSSDLEKCNNEAAKDNAAQESNQSDGHSANGGHAVSGSNEGSSADKDDSDTADWEKDLQDELQDFEFVSEDQGDNQEPNPEWEKEIEDMLGLDEDESEPTNT